MKTFLSNFFRLHKTKLFKTIMFGCFVLSAGSTIFAFSVPSRMQNCDARVKIRSGSEKDAIYQGKEITYINANEDIVNNSDVGVWRYIVGYFDQLPAEANKEAIDKVYTKDCNFNKKNSDKLECKYKRVMQDSKGAPIFQTSKYCVKFETALIETHDATYYTEVNSVAGNTGLETTFNYFQLLFRQFSIIASMFILFMVDVVALQMILAGSNEEGITTAKERMLQALLSLCLLYGSAMILNLVNPEFFSNQHVEKEIQQAIEKQQ